MFDIKPTNMHQSTQQLMHHIISFTHHLYWRLLFNHPVLSLPYNGHHCHSWTFLYDNDQNFTLFNARWMCI